jgi:hypothetical protein
MKVLLLFAAAGLLAAQELVVDRALRPGVAPVPQRIEAGAKGFLGDAFKFGKENELWIIDSVRVWVVPDKSPKCPKEPGDRYSELVLLGALDNPPVNGEPVCDCHAMVAVSTAALTPGTAASPNRNFQLTPGDGVWQLDFRNLRWSLPGNSDVIFSVRAKGVPKAAACGAAESFALSVSPAAPGHRLHTFDSKAVPTGLAEAGSEPRWINVAVWAHAAK